MDKTVVITGAGGVLCSGFAEYLASKGASVALLDLNAAAAETVAARITAAGGKAQCHRTGQKSRYQTFHVVISSLRFSRSGASFYRFTMLNC